MRTFHVLHSPVTIPAYCQTSASSFMACNKHGSTIGRFTQITLLSLFIVSWGTRHHCGSPKHAQSASSMTGCMQSLLILLRPQDAMFSPSVCVGTIRLQHGFVTQNLAYVSTEMATSIGVHGGAQQLLDILQAGFQQVRVWLTGLLVNLRQAVNHQLGCLCTCIKLSTTSWSACFCQTARTTSNTA